MEYDVKYELVEGMDKETKKPVLVGGFQGKMTAEEISRLLALPTFVKATIKNKGFNWKKPLTL